METTTLNTIAYLSHGLNAILILGFILFGVVIEKRDTFELEYQYTTWNNGTLAQKYVNAYEIRLSWLMFAFSALSFAFQMYVGLFNNVYHWEDDVVGKQHPHPLRFIEYAISAPVMFVGISLLSGVRNAHLIVALAVLVSVTMGCGLVAEYALFKSLDGDDELYMVAWGAHLFGWLGVGFAYGILFWTTGLVVASNDSESPPWFVWVIILFQAIAFLSFGMVQLVQLIRRKEKEEWVERAYIWLSLIAKTQLTWTTFFAVLVDV